MSYKNPEKERARQVAYHAANREKRNAQSRAYYAAHRKKRNAQAKAWREANIDKDKAQQLAYHTAHRKKRNAQSKAYRAAHREEIAENKARAIKVGGFYMGLFGMTRKQREKFQKEQEVLYGKTE